jgi:HK97 family phage portal protein
MLGGFFEQRAVSPLTQWAMGDDSFATTQSGTIVTQDNVFKVNAIFSAVSLISDTVATLPVDCFIRRDGARFPFRPKPTWVTKPDVDTTTIAFWSANIVSLLLDGNIFTRVFRDESGNIVNLVVLNPLKVEIKRNGLGRVMYQYDGSAKLLSSDEIIHIPDVVKPGELRGVSRVEALKDNFGLAIALESYAARFFGQGATSQGVIEFPGNLTPDQAKNLVDGFDSRHKGFRKAHKTGVLFGGAKYVKTTVDNDAAQFIDSRRLAVEDVARAFNIPTHLLGLPGTNTYSSVEQNNIAFVVHTLRPIVQKLESGYSVLLNTVPGGEQAFLKFNMDGLLRADVQSRMAAYSVGLQSGFLTINDVRRLEDLTPQNDVSAEQVRVPLANVNISAAGLTEQEGKVAMAQKLITVGFDPASTLAALGLPSIDHTGLPSQQLQSVAQIDPENPETVYGV